MTIEATKLRELIAKATDSDLSDGGRYFAETCNDLTNCRHGETGEYQDGHDGDLVEYLWNNRSLIAAALEGAYPDIGPDPMQDAGDRSLSAATGRLFMAYAKQQPGIPPQTALVWRHDIARVKKELTRLEALAGTMISKTGARMALELLMQKRMFVCADKAEHYAYAAALSDVAAALMLPEPGK